MSKQYFKAHLIKGTTPLDYALADTLCDLKDGFWINMKFEFTRVSDSRHWIPPSRILYIEKKHDI